MAGAFVEDLFRSNGKAGGDGALTEEDVAENATLGEMAEAVEFLFRTGLRGVDALTAEVAELFEEECIFDAFAVDGDWHVFSVSFALSGGMFGMTIASCGDVCMESGFSLKNFFRGVMPWLTSKITATARGKSPLSGSWLDVRLKPHSHPKGNGNRKDNDNRVLPLVYKSCRGAMALGWSMSMGSPNSF